MGTYDRNNYSFATTGSVDKVGFVLEHTDRVSNSPLTFRDYEDQSGLTYDHGGNSKTESDLVKVRYTLGDERTSVTASALDTNREAYQICAQDVTVLPCGVGPNNYSSGPVRARVCDRPIARRQHSNEPLGVCEFGHAEYERTEPLRARTQRRCGRPDGSELVRADARSVGNAHGYPHARRRVFRIARAGKPHLQLRGQHVRGDRFVAADRGLAIRQGVYQCRIVDALRV